jgi:mannose-P-dolichol utilization defect protein 1
MYSWLQGYPLTAYGENVVLVLQCLVVLLLVYRFSEAPVSSAEAVAVAAGLVLYPPLVCLLLPADRRPVLVASGVPLTCYASGSAVLEARRLGHTGSQSGVTVSLNLAGSALRFLTTLREVGWDYALLVGHGTGASLCAIQLAQIFAYRGATRAFVEQRKRRASRAKAAAAESKKLS